jgi:molybdenum cofactor cytidylyltransferase
MTTTTSQSRREFSLGVVILAAGLSTRMGRPKMLLPWHGTSVLGHLLQTWAGLDAGQSAVVCAASATRIHTELDRLHFASADRITNPSPEAGMFSSIQCAARWPNWLPSLSHFAVVLGDQPHLRRKTLGQLLEFAAANPQRICQPLRGGRRRHPVVMPREAFAKLHVTPVSDLKQFLETEPELLVGYGFTRGLWAYSFPRRVALSESTPQSGRQIKPRSDTLATKPRRTANAKAGSAHPTAPEHRTAIAHSFCHDSGMFTTQLLAFLHPFLPRFLAWEGLMTLAEFHFHPAQSPQNGRPLNL